MAKCTMKAKGKHPATTLQGEDGCFLPNTPDPPGSPSHLGLEPSGPLPQTGPEVAGTPMHAGGLGYHDPSSSEKIHITGKHCEIYMGHSLNPSLNPTPITPKGSPVNMSMELSELSMLYMVGSLGSSTACPESPIMKQH